MSEKLLVFIVIERVRKSQCIECPSEPNTPIPFEIILEVINALPHSMPADPVFLLYFIGEIEYFHAIII